jgi:DNA topoisomerase VI subunit B
MNKCVDPADIQLAETTPRHPSVFTMFRKRKTYSQWTPEREQLLRQMWASNASLTAIAAALGTTPKSVYNYRYVLKLSPRKIGCGRPASTPVVKPQNSPRRAEHKIQRVAFETSRLMEFCTEHELKNQTGHRTEEWPLVILKELVDNALDACEETGVAPIVNVSVETTEPPCGLPTSHDRLQTVFTIEDNGPGIPAATVAGILDYTVRVSSRDAYVSPTRGAQGNALKTVLPMGYVLQGTTNDTKDSVTLIEARGVAHTIRFGVDKIRMEPMIRHDRAPSSVRNGTRITITWPSIWLEPDAKELLVKLVSDFAWVNPHLSIRVTWNGEERANYTATNPAWTKWLPSDPTCPHWYDPQRFERYMAAHVAQSQKKGRAQFTVREFLSEFRGLSSTIKQKAMLEEFGAAHMPLGEFFGTSQRVNLDRINKLLESMKRHTNPVKPELIGVIGKDHFLARFKAAGGDPKAFTYLKKCKLVDGVPRVTEFAFGITSKGLEGSHVERLQLVNAVNWSAAIGNPFRQLGRRGESAEGLLRKLRVDRDDPAIVVVHLACPHIAYLDRGKSSIALD